jgi:hypothetical protein
MIKKNKYLVNIEHISYLEKEIEASSVKEARIIALSNLDLKNWKDLKKDKNKILLVDELVIK